MKHSHTSVCEQKHSPGEEDPWDNQFDKHNIRGWTGVSAAVLQGRGSRKGMFSFTDTGIITATEPLSTTIYLKLSFKQMGAFEISGLLGVS